MKEIIIEGLSKKIKGTLILDNVNMQMEPGKVYGLHDNESSLRLADTG